MDLQGEGTRLHDWFLLCGASGHRRPQKMSWTFSFRSSCCGGGRLGLDVVLPWLWQRPAATAAIRPLAWERAHARGGALKRQKKEFPLWHSGNESD